MSAIAGKTTEKIRTSAARRPRAHALSRAGVKEHCKYTECSRKKGVLQPSAVSQRMPKEVPKIAYDVLNEELRTALSQVDRRNHTLVEADVIAKSQVPPTLAPSAAAASETKPSENQAVIASLWAQIKDSPLGQFVMGAGYGGLAGAAPGGFVVGIASELSGKAEDLPPMLRLGYGVGETTWGIAQIIVGGFGEAGGGMLVLGGAGASATGGGALAGIPAMAAGGSVIGASTGVIVEGAADVGTGVAMAMSAWRQLDDDWGSPEEGLPEGTDEIRDTPDMEGMLSSDKASTRLSDALRANGDPPIPGHDAHHIVPHGHPRMERAREILEEAGIDIDSAVNGVRLPSTATQTKTKVKIVSEAATSHTGLHNKDYFAAVTERLENASFWGRNAVIKELTVIKGILKEGGRL